MSFRSERPVRQPVLHGHRMKRLLLIVVLGSCVGCREDRELTRMQAEVNRAATELVVQDAAARREWMGLQQQMDADRRQWATEARRDPIVAQAILQVGGLLLCLAPLWLAARLLMRRPADEVASPLDDVVFDHEGRQLLETRRDRGQPPSLHPPAENGPAPADLDSLVDSRMNDQRNQNS